MNLRYVLGGLLVVAVVAAGVGAALYTGAGPAPGGSSSEEIEEFPTETSTSDGDGGGSTATASETPPFAFTIDDVAECGQTCRDVTATLDNNQNESATNVTVYIRIFAGESNTDTDDVVWEGTEDVGTMDADSSHTTTKRVELSFQEARQVDQENGWITILTTVESDDTTVTFQSSEQVA